MIQMPAPKDVKLGDLDHLVRSPHFPFKFRNFFFDSVIHLLRCRTFQVDEIKKYFKIQNHVIGGPRNSFVMSHFLQRGDPKY